MNRSQSQQGFHGLTVAAFESRMAQEMTNLIARHGGTPLVAPSMQEVPLEHNTQAIEFGEHLMTGAIDMLILLTGVGTRALLEVWATRFSRESIIQALSRIVLVVRGPKPLGVLKELGISPQVCVPEPNTWHDVLTSLDAFRPQGLHGVRIGVQEYGAPNPELITGLHDRGAQVFTVPVYRWALPNDIAPLRHVLDTILRQEVDV
ncbi:MAG: uroporphyrinogen decarboxylase, partial [Nitrospirae bacterium]